MTRHPIIAIFLLATLFGGGVFGAALTAEAAASNFTVGLSVVSEERLR